MRESFSFVELTTMQPQGVEDSGELCVARPEWRQPFPAVRVCRLLLRHTAN